MSQQRGFIDTNGIVIRWPKKHSERIAVLAHIASKFSSERTYDENEVNDLIRQWHSYNDWSSIRRDLVGYGYATRDRAGLHYSFPQTATYGHHTSLSE